MVSVTTRKTIEIQTIYTDPLFINTVPPSEVIGVDSFKHVIEETIRNIITGDTVYSVDLPINSWEFFGRVEKLMMVLITEQTIDTTEFYPTKSTHEVIKRECGRLIKPENHDNLPEKIVEKKAANKLIIKAYEILAIRLQKIITKTMLRQANKQNNPFIKGLITDKLMNKNKK